MLTLTSQTIRKIGRGEDDDKWMGAALKYLATYDGREYLVKPDVGWPSNSTRERIAAAFYRAIGVRTANCVRAEVDGTDAVAVRIIPNANPIGDMMDSLSYDEAMDVVRGVLGAAMIGDGDKHCYNFITDGRRAYSIDHGLAFGGTSGRVNYTGGEHLTAFLSAGILTREDMHTVVDSLPESTGTLADLAYRHAGVPDGSVNVNGWRARMHDEIDRIVTDPYDMEYEHEDCDCEGCMPEEAIDCDDSGWGENGHEVYDAAIMRWRTCQTRRNARSAQARMDRSQSRMDHAQGVMRREHIEDCDGCKRAEMEVAYPCTCRYCERPAGRMAGKRCMTYKVFPRKVSDITRN